MLYQRPTGMRDLFEQDLFYFDKIEGLTKKFADFYDFSKINTPILEQTEIFEKGVGAGSDIVEKEMYNLKTKGGARLTLRPEITAGVARAYIENGLQALPKPVKLWYFGPCFRHERPQAGRYRQFYQFGFEALGSSSPVIDALIIQISYNILKSLRPGDLIVEVNSIGDKQCRPYFKKSLNTFLKNRQNSLCPDCRRRLKVNPLRVLDCKEPRCRRIIEKAPQIVDYLCKECRSHLKSLLEFLEELQLPYILNPYLVRGLDYYTKTVFEIYADSEAGRKLGVLSGGGRYDELIKLLGGRDTPACGVASGVERLANLLKTKSKRELQKEEPTVFLVHIGELAKRKALRLLDEFRQANLIIGEALCKDSLSVQLKMADKKQIKYVLILGQQEALENKIIIREMKTGRQKETTLKKVVKEMKKRAN